MKRSDLQISAIFLNTNKYLSIVYKLDGETIHIIDHNGSIYSVNPEAANDTFVKNYTKVEGITIKEFFDSFPSDKIKSFNDEKLKIYTNAIKRFNKNGYLNHNEEEILLIIK